MRYGCDEAPDELDPDQPPPSRRGRKLHVGPGFVSWRCPMAWACDAVAVEAWASWRWWSKGQLGNRGELPARLVVAVDALDAAINAAEHAYHKRHRPAPDGNGKGDARGGARRRARG